MHEKRGRLKRAHATRVYALLVIVAASFGRTGHESTRTIFGAAALWSLSQAESDQTLELLLEYGVNHIDTAASYGDSELRLAPWLGRHPGRFFLATKTGEREYTGAREQILHALTESKGRVGGADGAAARLGTNRTTLLSRMKRLGINARQFA